MPRLHADAPDLAISPEGGWAAELLGTRIRLYDLGRGHGRGTATVAEAATRLKPIAELDPQGPQGHPGRVVFLSEDRLLYLWQVAAGENGEENDGYVAGELFSVPTLNEAGRGIRVPGCTRILGVGPAGAVVAPSGPGADIIALRGNELVLNRTFIRGEVIAAIAAPERRFLMEQRSGFELWDPQARKALGRLVLTTRQPPAQVGFALAGRVLWAVTGTIPVHVELFRASDGRRLFELDQPGRSLQADAGPGRLVIAVEERGTIGFLDLDLGARGLRRVALPAGCPRPRSFVISPDANASEMVLLLESEESPLLRLSLARPLTRAAPSAGRAAAPRPHAASAGERAAAAEHSTRDLRKHRPETRLIRRAPVSDGLDDEASPGSGRVSERSMVSPLDDDAESDLLGDAEGAEAVIGGEGADDADDADRGPGAGRGGEADATWRRQREMLGRVFDASKSPAAWQWELARWAQTLLLATGSSVLPMPPEGGLLAGLGQRLRLSPIAQKVLGFLYGAQCLLGAHPQGMRSIELAQCLGPLHEEPTVLAELFPAAPLRALELLAARADGRVRLRAEVAQYLMGVPCPDLISTAGSGAREPLMPGLYLFPGVFPQKPQLLGGQPLVRVDGLRERRPVPALARALRRAQLYDAAVVVDGIPGLSYPAFASDGALPALRALLAAPRVPVLLCAMSDAPAAMGLKVRTLPALPPASVGLPVSGAPLSNDLPAPLLPSAPLPVGISWRAPTLPAPAAFVSGPTQQGRLEHLSTGDRRAGIVIGASATPEAYAAAAYLAARDGAVLVLDAELSTVRALVLGMLLRQVPVCVAAIPPAGPGTPWPAALHPFTVPLSPRV